MGINSLLSRQRKKQGTIYLEEKGLISDPHIVANKFNDFFLNVIYSSFYTRSTNSWRDDL